MTDADLVLQKLSQLQLHLDRVRRRSAASLDDVRADVDRLDALAMILDHDEQALANQRQIPTELHVFGAGHSASVEQPQKPPGPLHFVPHGEPVQSASVLHEQVPCGTSVVCSILHTLPNAEDPQSASVVQPHAFERQADPNVSIVQSASDVHPQDDPMHCLPNTLAPQLSELVQEIRSP